MSDFFQCLVQSFTLLLFVLCEAFVCCIKTGTYFHLGKTQTIWLTGKSSFSRYLEIVKSEGLEISQPALDPNSTEIHHRITIRSRMKKFHRWMGWSMAISEKLTYYYLCTYMKGFGKHRRVYELRGKTKCSNASEGPPCTGWVVLSSHCLVAW